VDATRWPRTAAFVDRVLAQECLAKLQPFEALMLRTPIRSIGLHSPRREHR